MVAPDERTRGRAGSSILAFLVAAALLPTSGCSFLFLDRPKPDYGRYEKVDCTTSYALPTVDTVLALGHIVSIAVVQSSSGTAYGGQKSRDALGQADISGLILYGASAIWGFYKVNQCNQLVETHGPYQPRGYPRAYRPPAPSGIQPPAPPQEPGIEPPPPGGAPVPTAPAPTSPAAPPTPAPTAPAAPPAPRARQQVDDE